MTDHPQAQESEREAFETWAKKEGYRMLRAPAPFEYDMGSTSCVWEAWKARAALASRSPAPVLLNGKPPEAIALIDALIDIYDDAQHNPPESRQYVESAWSDIIEECRQYLKTLATPQPSTPAPEPMREFLGKLVRAEWMKWASEQPAPKPSWLTPWDGLTEPEREVDRRIGEAIWKFSYLRNADNTPAPVAQVPTFDAFWKTLPIPGEFDAMDAIDQQRWKDVVQTAYLASPQAASPATEPGGMSSVPVKDSYTFDEVCTVEQEAFLRGRAVVAKYPEVFTEPSSAVKASPEDFLDLGLADVEDEGGTLAYFSRDAVLECISAALASKAPEPDLFWNDADPERGRDSIHEILDDEWGDGILSIGDTRVIQCAVRLANVTVRVIADPDDEDGFDYEEVAASTLPAPIGGTS